MPHSEERLLDPNLYSGATWTIICTLLGSQAQLRGHHAPTASAANTWPMLAQTHPCLSSALPSSPSHPAGNRPGQLNFSNPTINSATIHTHWLPPLSPVASLMLSQVLDAHTCIYWPCKYSHTCKTCGGDHPASQCPCLPRKCLPPPTQTASGPSHKFFKPSFQ